MIQAKTAAIYDIHGNLPALEAVLQDIQQHHVDHIVVGGDVVAGPMPVECLDRLQAEGAHTPMTFIHGNAESEVLRVSRGQPAGGLSPRADETARWVLSQLRPDQLDFIATWPLTATQQPSPNHTVLFCHATPRNDIDIFTSQTADSRLKTLIGDTTADLIICGHTHMQFKRQIGRTIIINAGSVGMPFGRTGAYWLLLEGDTASFKQTLYDLQQAAERITQTNYPEASQFATNNVLSSPAEAAVLNMLTQLEHTQIQTEKGFPK